MKGEAHIENTNKTYKMGDNKYKAGENYLLIMEENDSLFYENIRYLLVTDIYIPINNMNQSTMYGEAIIIDGTQKLTEYGDMRSFINNAVDKSMLNKLNQKSAYIKSEKIDVIVSESDLILEVIIEDIEIEGILHSGNTYVCKVLDILKGKDILITDEYGNILTTLLKESVNVGDKYILSLNKIVDTSIIYTQSSKNSVMSTEDKNFISNLLYNID